MPHGLRAGVPGQRLLDRPVVDRAEQDRRTEPLDPFDDLVAQPRLGQFGQVFAGGFEQTAGIAAHRLVAADQERLAGLPKADLPPAAIASHDAVDLIDRELQRDHADLLGLGIDGGGEEGGWRPLRRAVELEV